MKLLAQTFVKAGCKDVKTYINSGNVLFSDDRPPAALQPLLQESIQTTTGHAVPLILRTEADIALLNNKIPAGWKNDQLQKTDVMFLWAEIDNPDILQQIVINKSIENVLYLPGALVWNIGRDNVTKGGGIKLIKSDIYQHMTVRNINTVRKIHALLSAV